MNRTPCQFQAVRPARQPWRPSPRGVRIGALVYALTLSLGCGDDGGGAGPDAGGVADAALDAHDTDAATGDRSCSIKTGAAGLTAVLHNADGSVHTTAMTDATGTAAWEACPANAMMTFVVLDLSAGHRGVTVAGVQPGDHYEVHLPDLGLATIAAVEVPVDNAELTQVRVYAGHQCMESSTEGATAQVEVARTCVGDDPTKISILATGRLAAVNLYAYATEIPIGGGVTTTVDTMSGWMTGQQVTASATNAGDAQVSFSIQSMRGGKPFTSLSQAAIVTNGAATTPLPMPPSAFTSTKRVGVSAGAGFASRGIVRMSTDPTAAFAFDLTNLLPPITGLTVDNAIPARPVYTVSGTLTGTDLGIIRSTWLTNVSEVTWQIIFPSATQSVITFPVLPNELASARPDAAAASSVAAIDVTNASYAQLLGDGHHLGEFLHYCAAISAGAECWFTALQTP